MYFSADTFFILKNHGSIKGAILGNAKGGEHSPPFVRFPSNYCAASYSPPYAPIRYILNIGNQTAVSGFIQGGKADSQQFCRLLTSNQLFHIQSSLPFLLFYYFIIKTGPLAAVGADVLFHPARVDPAQIIRACAVEVIGTGRAKAHD